MLKAPLIIILLISNIFSYRLNNVAKSGSRWKALPIRINVNTKNADLSKTSVGNAIKKSMEEWNTKTHKNVFEYKEDDSIQATETIKMNGRNTITFSKNFAQDSGGFDPYTVVAVGGQFNNGEEMTDAFILFNSENIIWDSEDEVNSKSSGYRDDLNTIALHELGHVIGLGHSEVPEACMSTDRSVKIKRTLHTDDIEGANYLLGSAGDASSTSNSRFAGCASIHDVKVANNQIHNTSKRVMIPILLFALFPILTLLILRTKKLEIVHNKA